LGLGFAPSSGWVLAAGFVRALGSGTVWVFSAAILQATVDDDFRGRVFSFEFAILTLASAKHLEISGSDDIDTVGAAGAAALIHARLQGTSTPTQRPDFIFSDREALCLRWAAEGLPMHSIADVTGLTYHTVRWDLDRVKAKLGVYTQKQAVAVASRFGLI
jgi:DNA-binding CsgD family transcriptional regulator